MAYANPKKYFPNPWVGYCQEADGTENSMYIYSSPEECCSTGMVGEYDTCVTNTMNQSGPGPTARPTHSPVASSLPGNYYPDFAAGFCRSDGLHTDKPFVFASAEKCCNNQVMNYDECVSESINRYQEAPPTTPKPTSEPTKKPTPVSLPGNYYPDFTAGYCKSDGMHQNKPLVFSRAENCCLNDLMNYDSCLSLSIQNYVPAPSTTTTTTTTTPAKVYYPDLTLKVCKSDGKHGNTPYIFSSAHSCCENSYMDYERCMTYAAGYAYVPIRSDGYCRVSSGSETIAYLYNSPEDCCGSGIFDDISGCLSLSIDRLSGSDSGSNQVSSSTTSTTAAQVYYPDLVLKVCKSDGQQGSLPSHLLFSTAHSCCDNNYMNYETCMKYANGDTSVVQPTTTTTTTTTTSAGPKVYYPDLVLKVCKSDGKQGNLPYLFSTKHSCCDNSYFDYETCMKYTDGETGVIIQTTTTSTTSASATLAPVTPQPTLKPTQKPTEKYTPPPVVEAAIDARKFTDEVTDGFENGISGVFPWSTSPDKPWTIDKTAYRDGIASARSAPISKGETSDLYVAVNSDHGGTFFFSLKSDVQMPYSGFYVNVDDKSKMGYTFPFSDWRDLSVSIEAGQHVLMFRTWVPSIASGASTTTSGTVYVDKVSFQPHLIESFENQQLSWNAAEFVENDWVFDTFNPHGGSTSLRSPSLSSGETAALSFEFTTSSKGSTVEFWYDSKLSGGDMFEFKIDGFAVLKKVDSSGNWFMQSKSLVPGKHKLEWKFIKSAGAADSSVWIDDIRIRPVGV